MILNETFDNAFREILKMMENTDGRWEMPWHGEHHEPLCIATSKPYTGGNKLILIAEQLRKKYTSGYWGTLKQWNGRGSKVLRGQKGTPLFMPILGKTRNNGIQDIRGFRTFHVFNGDQVSNFNPHHPDLFETEHPKTKETPIFSSHELGEYLPTVLADIIDSNSIKLVHHEQRAYYSIKNDYINMPVPQSFKDTESSSAQEHYCCTLLHELIHWTGHRKRLNRFSNFDSYAFEELVAELGAAFFCIELGIFNSPRQDHAKYLNSWLSTLKNDIMYLHSAATLAQMAINYLKDKSTNTQQGHDQEAMAT
jgi:antirestriction protein ArdC